MSKKISERDKAINESPWPFKCKYCGFERPWPEENCWTDKEKDSCYFYQEGKEA